MKKKNTTILKVLLFICLLGSVNIALSQSSLPELEKKIPVAELKSDFKIIRENLEKLHIGLYTYTPKIEFNKTSDEIESELDEPLTAMEFFRKITRLNKLIRNGHTSFSPPQTVLDAIRKDFKKFPIEPYWDGENLYVVKNLSSDKTIKEGSKIRSINDVPAKVLIKEMADMLHRDGYNETYPIYRINDRFAVHYAVLKEITDTYEIELEDSSGEIKKVKINGLSNDKIEENRITRYKTSKVDWRETKEPALILSVDGEVAVMTIKTFEEDLIKKKKQKWKSFFKKSFKKINKDGVKHLIIDLRGNRGGQPEPTIGLLSYLYDKPFTIYKSITTNVSKLPRRPYYVDDGSTETFEDTKWISKGNTFEPKDREVFKLHKPDKNQYKDKLYILTDAFSTSATGTLAGQLKSKTNAIFIGEEAGGNPNQTVARQIVDVILPNSKVKVSVPLVLSVKDVDFENKGRGIIPDHPVNPTINDLINNKDAAMEFALNLIKKM